MIDTLSECQRLLADGGIASTPAAVAQFSALTLESPTVLGFVLSYPDAETLLTSWERDLTTLVGAHQFALRRAQAKAWNTYAILLAGAACDGGRQFALSALEENLVGTRKIVRAGVSNVEALRVALLPLLPIQNAPRLEAVDMKAEIQLRTTELPQRLLDAFLSDAPDAAVAQVLGALS